MTLASECPVSVHCWCAPEVFSPLALLLELIPEESEVDRLEVLLQDKAA